MDFSLILPTLGEQEKVKQFLDSIERTTTNKKEVEVLFAVDKGMTEIQKFVDMQEYSFRISFYARPKTDNFSDDYYNWLADRSIGKTIWACNDDIWIKTNGWDDKIRSKINRHGWSVYLVDTHETTRGKINKDFCCFPMISRKSVTEIGFFFYKQVRVYPADKIIYGVYKKIGRIIDAQDIEIQSVYVSEDTDTRRWGIYQEDLKNGALNIDITREVLKLLLVTKDDPGPKGDSKIDRIIKIIKEK